MGKPHHSSFWVYNSRSLLYSALIVPLLVFLYVFYQARMAVSTTSLGKLFSIVVFVPVTHGPQVRAALASAGAGTIGNYDSCSFSSRGVGRFRPLDGAKPFIGTVGAAAPEEVEEERIETEVFETRLLPVLKAVRAAHPYEQPAIHIHELVDWERLLRDSSSREDGGK
jgi:hypothetical protein